MSKKIKKLKRSGNRAVRAEAKSADKLRKLARAHGLSLAQSGDPIGPHNFGGYQLVAEWEDEPHIVLGASFEADLDDVSAYLEQSGKMGVCAICRREIDEMVDQGHIGILPRSIPGHEGYSLSKWIGYVCENRSCQESYSGGHTLVKAAETYGEHEDWDSFQAMLDDPDVQASLDFMDRCVAEENIRDELAGSIPSVLSRAS